MAWFHHALSRTRNAIRTNKRWLLVLIILEIMLVGALVYVGLIYQEKIFTNIQAILGPLQNANYDAQSLQEGVPFTEDFFSLYQSYNALIGNAWQLAFWVGGLLLVFQAGIWIISHYVISKTAHKKNDAESKSSFHLRELMRLALQFLTVTIIIAGPFLLFSFFYLQIKLSLDVTSFWSLLQVPFYVGIFVYYCLLVAYASLDSYSWKMLWYRFVHGTVKSFYKIVPIIVLIAVLFIVSLSLVYLSMAYAPSLIIPASIIPLIVIVITRIFLIACLEQITSLAEDHLAKLTHETHPA